MRLPDFWTGLLFAGLGIAIAVYATTFRIPAGAASPQLFPIVIGTIMAAAGGLIAVRGIANLRDFERPDWVSSPRRVALFAYIPFAIVVFALLAESLGTILLSTAIVTVHTLIYGLRLIPAVTIGLLAGAGIPLIFTRLLGIPLPAGIIERLI